MTLRVSVTGRDNDPLLRFQWARAAVRWADEIGPAGRSAIKAKTPVGKGPSGGRLRDSVKYKRTTAIGSGITVTFTAHTPYAKFVIDGTPPHVIEARAAKVLHWTGPNGDVFRRRVNHPGTQPNPFPRKALLPMMPYIQQRYREAIISDMRRG